MGCVNATAVMELSKTKTVVLRFTTQLNEDDALKTDIAEYNVKKH